MRLHSTCVWVGISFMAMITLEFVYLAHNHLATYEKHFNREVYEARDAVPVYYPRIVASYPHDTSAFTQGLCFLGNDLYESVGIKGRSAVRHLLLNISIPVNAHRNSPDEFGEGLTAFGNQLYQLSYRSRRVFVYDRALNARPELRYPFEGWGLTHDKYSFIASNGSEYLMYFDPRMRLRRTLKVSAWQLPEDAQVRPWPVRIKRLNELEFVNGYILANIYKSNFIAVISPATGYVVQWLNLTSLVPSSMRHPEAVLNGIAHQEGSSEMLITGKFWPYLVSLSVPRHLLKR